MLAACRYPMPRTNCRGTIPLQLSSALYPSRGRESVSQSEQKKLTNDFESQHPKQGENIQTLVNVVLYHLFESIHFSRYQWLRVGQIRLRERMAQESSSLTMLGPVSQAEYA